MNAKKLLPLIVILAILGGLAVLRKGSEKTTSIIQQVSLEQVIPDGMKAEDLAKLELFSGKKPEEKVVLTKDGETWKVTSQFNAPAKADTVKEYLDALVKVKGEFRAETGGEGELDSYKLSDAQAFHVLAYKSGDDKPAIDLLVGKSPDYKTIFLRKNGGNRVYAENTNLRSQAGLYSDDDSKGITADKWLDKDVLKLDEAKADKVTKLALTMPDKALAFERHEKPQPAAEGEKGEGQQEGESKPAVPAKKEFEWKLASGGLGGELKSATLDTLLGKFKSLQATNVADPAKAAEFGLDKPAFKAVLSMDGESDIVIDGGRPDPSGDGYIRLASANNGMIYQLSKYAFDQLFVKGSDFFELPTQTMKQEDITEITIEQPEGRIVAHKEGEAWKVTEPALSFAAQESALTSLASTLAALKPVDYADAGADVGAANATLTFTAAGAVHTIVRSANAKSVEGAYVKVDSAPQTVVLSKTDLGKLFPKVRDVFELALLDLDESLVANVALTQGADTYAMARGDDGWTWTAGADKKVLPLEAGDNFIAELTELQAKDITPATAQPVKVGVTVTMKDGVTHALQFGADEKDEIHTVSLGANVYPADKDGVKRVLDAVEKLKKGETPEGKKAEEPPAMNMPMGGGFPGGMGGGMPINMPMMPPQ